MLVIAGGSWFYFKYVRATPYPTPAVTDETPEMEITAKHQWKNGTHIVAGDVNLPTPCYILNTNAVVAESYPEQVTINFVASTQGEACAQVVTTERFKVDFQASEKAIIKATWNGKPAKLNLIPAGPNEDLNNFELFLKG